ncbi:hypothetical protein M513_12494 [Trichuris suis]|uniref:Helix-turn-helix domain-containing protein n=1 Tax=Trichuris suis TaxID=68888 RepID=A0A085LNU3_9BILA|nr:hypothetical protein M513_12494 [Trichuris suis]
MVNFYQRFITAATKIMQPLYKALANHPKQLAWNEATTVALHCTKEALAKATMCVDDIFAITKRGTETSFLHHLNSLFPNQVTFTMEVESHSRLSSLDILILNGSSSLHTTVYRKPTHSDKYLHFNSHHPKSVKIGIISNLVDSALSICEPRYLPTELRHIENVLLKNGYPHRLIRSVIQKRIHRPPQHNSRREGLPTLVVPYIQGISERLMVLAKTLNFRLFFKSSPNFRSILRNDLIKLPPSEKPGVVYEVRCECSASYIGETGFTLPHRYKQHVKVLKRLLAAKWKLLSTTVDSEKESQKKIIEQCKKDPAVAAHAASCLQRLYPHVVCHEPNYKQRKIKEALYIRQNTTINRDQGMEVSNIWFDLLRRTRSCSLQAP